MEILYTPDHLIIKQTQFSLWFKRFDSVTNHEFKTGVDFSKLENLKCLGIAYTLIGSFNEDSLLFTVRNQLIGSVPSDLTDLNVYLIKKVALIYLNANLDNLLINNEFDACPVHGHQTAITNTTDQLNEQQQPNQLYDNASSNVQTKQRWNTWIKSTANSTANLLTNTNANFNLNDEILKMFNETDSFYYCENGDLTNTLQRKNSSQYLKSSKQSKDDDATPFWKRADDRFFFNRHLLNFLIDSSSQSKAQWILPIIQGFVQIEDCKISLEETNEFRLILISRRSRFRAGTRFKRRGVDENGRCANYCETEQIIKFNNHVVSFVQVRGSIPVFWSQPGLSYRPTPVLERTLQESQQAFAKHFEEEFIQYNKVTAINLVERNGRESIIGEAYLNCILDFNSEKLTYVGFDFHNQCRGMKFGNVNILIDTIQEQIKEMLFFWKEKNDGVICRQIGVFRVNCVDCLDRTNLVQSSIGKFVLLNQLNKLAILPPDCQLPFNCRKSFQQLWANNGDMLARQYAGTRALKSDYTRLGERRLTGVMMIRDGYNSASRYYMNVFKDAYRQAAIDTLLGNPIDLPDLNELPDQNNNDAQEEDTDRIKQIIEDVKMFCIAEEHEIILGNWGLVSATNSISNEMDSILVLTKDKYYVANYDCERDRVTKCQCVLLEDIEKIELGPSGENFQFFGVSKSIKLNYCVRIYYLYNSSTGYFHMFRPSSIRYFNNMAIPIKTPEDSIESLKSIVESFKVALSVKNISVPIFEGKLIAKKSKKPQAVYFAKKINQQSQKLPRNISDNNLLRFKNVGKTALNNVSSQFARFKSFKEKFTGSTRSNINLNLPDIIYESMDSTTASDLRNNSCTSLSIVNEGTLDYVKTNLKPRLTDPSSIASTSSIALNYTTTEDERTFSSEFSSTDELDEEDEFSGSFKVEEDYSKQIDPNDTLLESCGILSTSNKHGSNRPKSESGLYSSDEADDFVVDYSMNKASLNKMLTEVRKSCNSPKLQITNQDFRSSDCYLNTAGNKMHQPNLDNSVSCANLNTNIKETDENEIKQQRLLVGNNDGLIVNDKIGKNLDNEDCTRSTMDIHSTLNTKRNQNQNHTIDKSRIKSSKSETPLINLDFNSSTSKLTTIGKRDLIFNPLSKMAKDAIQNISLISRRYNKSFLSNEELERLAERKKNSKSLIIEIE